MNIIIIRGSNEKQMLQVSGNAVKPMALKAVSSIAKVTIMIIIIITIIKALKTVSSIAKVIIIMQIRPPKKYKKSRILCQQISKKRKLSKNLVQKKVSESV